MTRVITNESPSPSRHQRAAAARDGGELTPAAGEEAVGEEDEAMKVRKAKEGDKNEKDEEGQKGDEKMMM